jgi:hypothetical protein
MPGDPDPSVEFSKKHNIPVEAARGGAETALPEFMRGRQPASPNRSGQ